MDIDDLPPKVQFCFLAMLKSAIAFKEMKKDKEFFLGFSEEIWNSMELSDLDYLNETIEGKMKKDIQPYVDEYVKNQKKEKK